MLNVSSNDRVILLLDSSVIPTLYSLTEKYQISERRVRIMTTSTIVSLLFPGYQHGIATPLLFPPLPTAVLFFFKQVRSNRLPEYNNLRESVVGHPNIRSSLKKTTFPWIAPFFVHQNNGQHLIKWLIELAQYLPHLIRNIIIRVWIVCGCIDRSHVF